MSDDRMGTVLWVLGAVVVTATIGVKGEGDPITMIGIASAGITLISLPFLIYMIFVYEGPSEKAPYIRNSIIGTAVGLIGFAVAYFFS